MSMLTTVACSGRTPQAVDAGDEPVDARPCGACQGYGPPYQAGTVASDAVNELSGIAASHRYTDVYYVQDDDPVTVDGVATSVHAIDGTGRLLANWALDGVRVGNLEVIGVGPCPAGSCLYTGDVGNNSGDQSPYPMYRIPEPSLDVAAAPTTGVLTDFDRIRLEYPDGAPRDCEAMAVHPVTADLYLFEKKTGSTTDVFKVPAWPAEGTSVEPLVMTFVGTLSLVADGATPADEQVTGADIHPCAGTLLVRTYGRVYEYTVPPGQPFDAVFATLPVRVPNPGGSEAIGYAWDGQGYLSVPEGANPALSAVRCAQLPAPAAP